MMEACSSAISMQPSRSLEPWENGGVFVPGSPPRPDSRVLRQGLGLTPSAGALE